MKFSVLDVETTGFSYNGGDRIVELSIISIDAEGNVLDTFDTLVNPKRDVGAFKFHGITPEMVREAPTFDEIADSVLEIIDQSVIVAHNAVFDTNFLKKELERSHAYKLDFKGLCTLQLSRMVVPELPSRKLEVLCNYFDIPLYQAHTAYFDCLATKDLFLKLYDLYRKRYSIDDVLQEYFVDNLLSIVGRVPTSKRIEHKRTQAEQLMQRAENRLREMILRLPAYSVEANVSIQEYLDLLDETISDRIITEEEADKLFQLSGEFNISRDHAIDIHEEYLRRLIRIYLLDGVISQSEIHDLRKVAKLLGLGEKLELLIDLGKANLPASLEEKAEEARSDCAGLSVCFTGELCSCIRGRPIDRQYAQELALAKGLIVKSGVSKKLDMLVVADPHTQSNKAKRARELNVKIVAEPVFWRMIGVSVE